MARPIKEGLDYFAFDIDFFHDQKIEFVSAKYGIEGEIIAIKLLCKIYREGYYLNWGDDECLLFSKKVGENIPFERVKNVVDELLKRDFFNQDLYKKFNILTSKGIQKRYFEAIKRRKDFAFRSDYCLINGVNVYNNPINVDINPQNVDINSQSKVKETKVKETKEKREYAPLVFMTEEEHQKLVNKLSESVTDDYIEDISLYCQSHGKRYKNYYATVLAWHRKDEKEGKVRKPADEERKPKYIPTAKLTPEQMEVNKRKVTEMLNKLKAGVDMPETAEGG